MTTGSASSGWPVEGRPVIRRAPGASRPGTAGFGAALRAGLQQDQDPVRTTRSHEPGFGDLEGRRHLRGVHLEELRPLLIWVACLVVAVVAFGALGRTPMSSPPVTAAGDWWSWAQESSADLIAFNVLRILGVALAWYLLGVTAVGALARIVAWGGLVRAADLLTVGPVRTILQQALGATLAFSAAAAIPGSALSASPAVTGQAPSSVTVEHPATVTEVPVLPGASGQRVVEGDLGRPDTVIPERSLRPPGAAPHDSWVALLGQDDATVATRPALTVEPTEVEPTEVGPTIDERGTHTIAPGDHFWAIAQEIVGREANEHEVMEYWTRLVDANRDRLVAPGNPDLLLPGQVIVLPDARDVVRT